MVEVRDLSGVPELVELTTELKHRARVLQRQAEAGDPSALKRLRAQPQLRALDDAAMVGQLKRRHCLAVLAIELGFRGWSHMTGILGGEEAEDYGTLLCPPEADAHWNIWCASYDEASTIRGQTSGYLLAYKHHFFIVDRYFIETLGLDPGDPNWDRIGHDWARPQCPEARGRLYARLIRQRNAL